MKNLLLIFFFISCNTSVKEESSLINRIPASAELFTGFDIEGNRSQCGIVSLNNCNQSYGVDEEFRDECLASGAKVVQCGCHDYICEKNIQLENIKEGKTINGELKSCKSISQEVICTDEFTEEDAYAIQCQQTGGEAVQCDCHDWICVR